MESLALEAGSLVAKGLAEGALEGVGLSVVRLLKSGRGGESGALQAALATLESRSRSGLSEAENSDAIADLAALIEVMVHRDAAFASALGEIVRSADAAGGVAASGTRAVASKQSGIFQRVLGIIGINIVSNKSTEPNGGTARQRHRFRGGGR